MAYLKLAKDILKCFSSTNWEIGKVSTLTCSFFQDLFNDITFVSLLCQNKISKKRKKNKWHGKSDNDYSATIRHIEKRFFNQVPSMLLFLLFGRLTFFYSNLTKVRCEIEQSQYTNSVSIFFSKSFYTINNSLYCWKKWKKKIQNFIGLKIYTF